MPQNRGFIPAQTLETLNYKPRLICYIDGHYIPATLIDVDLSAYGTADAFTVTTFFNGLYEELGNVSILRRSQISAGAGKPLTMTMHIATDELPTTQSTPLAYGYLDKIHIDAHADTITFHGRGIAGLLLDPKITAVAKNTQSIESAISDVCKKYNVPLLITQRSGLRVGKVMKDDFVTTSRNLSAFAYIQTLSNAVGWDIRAKGAVLVIGPPPNPKTELSLKKVWGTSTGGVTASFDHDAFHSHNVKVRIISYHQGHKNVVNVLQGPSAALLGLPPPAAGASAPTSAQGPAASLLNMPLPTPGAGKHARSSRGGRVGGYSGTDPRPSAREEIYVFHMHGLDQATATIKAKQMADAISRREIRAQLEWMPDRDELIPLATAACEVNIQLSGFSDGVLNGLYFPQELNYSWGVYDGLKLTAHLLNHITPQDDQGVA